MFVNNRILMATCVLAAGLAAPACVTQSKYLDAQQRIGSLEDQLMAAEGNLRNAEDMIMELDAQGEDVAEWQRRAAELEARIAELQNSGGIPGVEGADAVYYPTGEYGYQLAGDLTFAVGSANLTAKGKKILSDVATQVKSYDGKIRVDGHTDSDPVNKTKAKWPEGNIQLGAARAISVYKFLIEQGVPESKLSVASYASHRPAMEGKSSSAKAKNRRVEILMIFDDNAQG